MLHIEPLKDMQDLNQKYILDFPFFKYFLWFAGSVFTVF